MERVLYSTSGDGRWYKTTIPKQCRQRLAGDAQRCQGIVGHDGDHWAFDEAGRYCYLSEIPDPDGVVYGEIPPSHPSYKSPLQLEKYYYMGLGVKVEVTNALEIDRLNRGNMRPGETISRPISLQEFEAATKESAL